MAKSTLEQLEIESNHLESPTITLLSLDVAYRILEEEGYGVNFSVVSASIHKVGGEFSVVLSLPYGSTFTIKPSKGENKGDL